MNREWTTVKKRLEIRQEDLGGFIIETPCYLVGPDPIFNNTIDIYRTHYGELISVERKTGMVYGKNGKWRVYE